MTYHTNTTMEIHVISPETVVLGVRGPLQIEHAQQFGHLLDELCTRPQPTKAVDLSQTSYMASAGIGALMLRQKLLAQRGEEIRIWGCSEHVRKSFEIIKLDQLFEIRADPPAYPSASRRNGPLTIQRLKDEAERHLRALEWSLWAYKQVVYVEVHENVSIAAADNCLSEVWGIFMQKSKEYASVFLLLDTKAIALQSSKLRQFIDHEWGFILDRPEYIVCFIDHSAMKRVIWEAMFTLLGKQEQIKIFPDSAAALRWVEKLAPVAEKTSSRRRREK